MVLVFSLHLGLTDTDTKRKTTHHTSMGAFFPRLLSAQQSELGHQILNIFSFWRCLHLYFLTPLEEPAWQRSEDIRRHVCHPSVSAACSWRRAAPVLPVEFKKDSNPPGLKDPSFALKSSCQMLRESLILSGRRADEFQRLVSYSAKHPLIIDWRSFLHLYWTRLTSGEVHLENLRNSLLCSMMPWRNTTHTSLKFCFSCTLQRLKAGNQPQTGGRRAAAVVGAARLQTLCH